MLDPFLFASTLVTLFVILDPPGLLPVFLGLTRGMGRRERHRSALGAIRRVLHESGTVLLTTRVAPACGAGLSFVPCATTRTTDGRPSGSPA